MKYFLTKNITSLEKKVMMTFRVNALLCHFKRSDKFSVKFLSTVKTSSVSLCGEIETEVL